MVRYADGPTTTSTVHVAASPDVVWRLISDIDLPARFSDEFQGAEWIEGGESVGARFRGRNWNEHMGEWSTVCTVTEWTPAAAFAYVVEDPANPTASWRFDLTPSDGGTDLSMTTILGPGPSGLTPLIERMPDKEEKIIANRLGMLRTNMDATLEGIRSLAERSG